MSYQQVKNHRRKRKKDIIYIMGDKCCICGYNKCQSALELHHLKPEEKDFTIGQTLNKDLEIILKELQKCILVCANCHREIHSGLIESLNNTSFIQSRANEILTQKNKLITHQVFYCKNCGNICSKKDSFCLKCSNLLKRQIKRPSREVLKDLIRNKSFSMIGRIYNVSDNAIRKWCISMGLPSRKTDINKITDEEWLQI